MGNGSMNLVLSICCSLALTLSQAEAIELIFTNGRTQLIDIYVDGNRVCSLQPYQPQARRADSCKLDVRRGRHQLTAVGEDWRNGAVYNFKGQRKVCLIESTLSCCCNEDDDPF
jgi:hypothetical protein